MSIRFKFTLLYSAILALTLAAFGVALYSIQSQNTWEAIKRDQVRTGEGLEEFVHMIMTSPYPYGMGAEGSAWPKSFMFFSTDIIYTQLPEWELIRILNAEGHLLASPYGRIEDALPISPDGLRAVKENQEWWESITVKGQRVLLYCRPVLSGGELVSILQVGRPLTERDRSLRTLSETLILVSLITLVLASGIGWVFSGFAFRPIRRLTETAKAIGEERDFTRRVAYTGPQDEVGRLATTFNEMLARLQDAYQRVAVALEQQRLFMVDVSHELRTPLTTLRGNLDLLRRDPPIPSTDRADILADMSDESDRLVRLVNELLLLARADVRRNLAQESVALRPLLEETCRQARFLDPQRSILLDSEEIIFQTNRDALKQTLLIVLDNALKHSSGDVSVTGRPAGGRVEIRIRDSGEGIPPAQLEHIFDRFYRAANSAANPGFGLGLAIAKSLVEGQGGTISMESELGKGSEIILSFPAQTAAPG
ncbi:MAG: HAMP domain-containing histidine kinase [Anaerolineales bacterium]|nr:HAMP domain-containing histidine kinase [Anaerolineales bacterium]